MTLNSKQKALVEEHVPLAKKIAGIRGRGWLHQREDLVSSAYEALCLAALKFKEDAGFPFKNYAAQIINREISHYLYRFSFPLTRPYDKSGLKCSEEIELEPIPDAPQNPSQEFRVYLWEVVEAGRRALAGLYKPEQTWDVFVSRAVEEDLHETAARHGVTYDAVERSRRQFKKRLVLALGGVS